RVVAGRRAEDFQQARDLRHHLAAQLAVGERLVADDVDRADLRFRPFVDLEDDVDTVLVELHHLRLYGRSKAALALVQFDDARDVRPNLGAGEDLPRRQLDLGKDLVVLEATIAFQHDPVDYRVLDHSDDYSAVVVPDREVGEQLGRGKILQGLVGQRGGIDLPRTHADIADDRRRLEALGTGHRDRADDMALFAGGSCGRRRRRRRCWLRGSGRR